MRSSATPCFAATASYMASRIGAVRVDGEGRRDLIERDPVEDGLHVGERIDGDADLAHLAGGLGRVGVEAELGRQIERHREPGLPLARR